MMSGSNVRYMDCRESLKQGSLDKTHSFKHCIYDILQNNMYISAYENFSKTRNFNLVQIACKMTSTQYANNSVLKIRNQS